MVFCLPGLGLDPFNRCQRIAVNGFVERIERIAPTDSVSPSGPGLDPFNRCQRITGTD